MSRGKLVLYQSDGDPVVMEFDVQETTQNLTVEIAPNEVRIIMPNEPKVSYE